MRIKKEMHPFDDLVNIIKGRGKIEFEIRNERDAYDKSVWVARCIDIIALKISTIPIKVMINDKTENKKIIAILNRPSQTHTYNTFMRNVVSWCKIYGFVIITSEYPQYRIIDSDRVSNQDGHLYERDNMGKVTPINMEKSIIIRNFTLSNNSIGMPQILSLMPTLQYQSLIEQASRNVLKNGGITPYVLTTQQQMNEGMIDKIIRMWKEKFSGIDNAGETPILPNGLTIQNVGLGPVDMGILSQEAITKNRIATLFGVPMIYLNDTEHVDYATAEIQMRIFAYNTIVPEAIHFIEQLNRFLIPLIDSDARSGGGIIVPQFKHLYEMQEDDLKKSQNDQIRLMNGVVTINEIRTRDGLNPVSWGNEWWRSYGLTDGSEFIYSEDEVKTLINKSTEELTKESKWKLYIARTFSQEKKFASEMKKFFARVEKDTLESLPKSMTDITTKAFNEEEYEQILTKVLKPLYLAFSAQAITNAKDDYGLTVDFSVGNPAFAAYTENVMKETSAEIIKTTSEKMTDILQAGITEGKSVLEISKDIQDYFDFAKTSRSKMIARTEVNAINSYASQETAKAGGLRHKIWSAALDEKTRDSHRMADGQEVGINDDFTVGGHKMKYAGDQSAPAKERINCRCTETYR